MRMIRWKAVFLVFSTYFQHILSQENTSTTQSSIEFGSCKFVVNGECPDPDVTFFMYSTTHPDEPEQIFVGKNLRASNLARTAFDPTKPSKLIIHGYNSDMFLNALTQLRIEYLKNNDCNVFTVDWSPLNQAPCYPAAVWNARHVGECSAQLVQRLRDMGADDIHVIGFSLGAQITNFISLALRPYLLPRITGLDPALPGYITANNDAKLDKSDAEFVDVYHTNAFMQAKAEESGHVDFYFNGGSVQPGCVADLIEDYIAAFDGPEILFRQQRKLIRALNMTSGDISEAYYKLLGFFACNHHRAPLYYAESINSKQGFWGWPCPSYFQYLFGRCPPQNPEVRLGEFIDKTVRGVYLVLTRDEPPFAIGRFEPSKIQVRNEEKTRMQMLKLYRKNILDMSGLDEEEMYREVYRNRIDRRALKGVSYNKKNDFVKFVKLR